MLHSAYGVLISRLRPPSPSASLPLTLFLKICCLSAFQTELCNERTKSLEGPVGIYWWGGGGPRHNIFGSPSHGGSLSSFVTFPTSAEINPPGQTDVRVSLRLCGTCGFKKPRWAWHWWLIDFHCEGKRAERSSGRRSSQIFPRRWVMELICRSSKGSLIFFLKTRMRYSMAYNIITSANVLVQPAAKAGGCSGVFCAIWLLTVHLIHLDQTFVLRQTEAKRNGSCHCSMHKTPLVTHNGETFYKNCV